MSVDDEELELFKSEMGDVAPLKTEKKVALKGPMDDSPGMAERRRAAQAAKSSGQAGLSVDYIIPVEPLAILSFVRPGIQQGVYKKLRLGKYQIDARLDLHRMTVEEARRAILQFVKDCLSHDVRCALVTHGKGIDRKPQPAMLKSCVSTWLPELEQVLAFHSAQPFHGGAGATYVLLRKSDKKKRSNWERHIGKRG